MKFSKIVVAMLLAAMATSAPAAQVKVGKPVPDVLLVLADGTKVHLSDLRGQIVVLNLWATWCVPCRTELPQIDGYYRVAQQRGWPLKIFAVATEDEVPKYQLTKLFKHLAITQTDKIRSSQFDDQEGLPTNYVIDKAGILRYAKAGAFDLNGLNAVIGPLLREPAPAQ